MGNNKTFTFTNQLRVGDLGESLFKQNYPAKLEVFEGRKCDFKCIETGKLIEVKTDTYCATKTENFFFERYSNEEKETPGGPWRAKKDRIDIFCYIFASNGYCYEFGDVKALVKRLDYLVKKINQTKVKNLGYMTIGYKVPRKDVEDLFTLWEWNLKKETL